MTEAWHPISRPAQLKLEAGRPNQVTPFAAERHTPMADIRKPVNIFVPPIERDPNSPPLEIRTHHLGNFQDLMYLYKTDGLAAADTYAEYLHMSSATLRVNPDLANDINGNTEQEGSLYKKKAARFYRDFLLMKDEDPVVLVVGEPDTFCKTCPLRGEHCRKNNLTGYNLPTTPIEEQLSDNIAADEEAQLNSYLRYIKATTRKEPITDITTVSFTDHEPLYVRNYTTTVGTLKSYLKQSKH